MTATLTAVRVSPRAERPELLRAVPDTASAREDVPDEPTTPDIVDIWGLDSFPASDAPANW